jgi:hypothetical protein
MNEWQPRHEWPPATGRPPTTGRAGLTTALRQRERSRGRIRLITVTVGAAALATAGVVAYQLPAPAHTTTGGRTTTPAAQPSAVSQRSGDDGQGDGGTVAAPTGTGGQSAAQATSGGS